VPLWLGGVLDSTGRAIPADHTPVANGFKPANVKNYRATTRAVAPPGTPSGSNTPVRQGALPAAP